ncbi:RNA polymerase sigma factor [Candidatus Palauibacter sp.]|uniref:RNA polymerase sigma factor n=1 Tax=Candidatus Palauibacter sp. TaxID=3101350 RepID=UPI003B026805
MVTSVAEDTRKQAKRPAGIGRPGSRPENRPDPGADEPGLVEAVQAGDIEAFSRFVTRYTDPAYAVALSILRQEQDAEDAVQAAFIRALERIGQLRPGSRFGPWFYRVLRSTCLNLRRRELLRTHSELTDTAASRDDPHREFERSDARSRVLAALERLPERQRTAVMMYDLEGYDHAEIAGILGIAVGTSRANLHHGRHALRRVLSESAASSAEGAEDEQQE